MAVDPTTRVRLLIQRQFAPLSAIELLLEGVTRFNLVPAPENHENIIYEAALLVRDGLVYWADWGGWDPNLGERDEYTWIASRVAKWRDATEWLGDTLRYGPVPGLGGARTSRPARARSNDGLKLDERGIVRGACGAALLGLTLGVGQTEDGYRRRER